MERLKPRFPAAGLLGREFWAQKAFPTAKTIVFRPEIVKIARKGRFLAVFWLFFSSFRDFWGQNPLVCLWADSLGPGNRVSTAPF